LFIKIRNSTKASKTFRSSRNSSHRTSYRNIGTNHGKKNHKVRLSNFYFEIGKKKPKTNKELELYKSHSLKQCKFHENDKEEIMKALQQSIKEKK
jgi:hypothetical protein